MLQALAKSLKLKTQPSKWNRPTMMMVRDLLVGFVREPWVAEVDLATLERYPTEFIDDRFWRAAAIRRQCGRRWRRWPRG